MIRKITICVALTFFAATSFSQTNLSLDTWATDIDASNWSEPFNGWAGTTDTSVTEATVGNTGSAAHLNPVDLNPLQVPLWASFLELGDQGIATTNIVDSIYFFIKQSRGSSDLQTQVEALLTKNGDTVAYGFALVGQELLTYTKVGFEMDYSFAQSMATPDSMFLTVIALTSADPEGAYAEVDDFVFTPKVFVGIKEVAKTNRISVYPTIANSKVTFEFNGEVAETLVVTDLNGRIIETMNVSNSIIKVLDVKNYNNGTYFYSITNQTNQPTTGRFIVLK
ncbi:MAG: hypothetical protein ACI9XP_001619 [Lentimonas sp.]|jgi:hypothetical protein